MQFFDVIQGSEEWFNLRKGIATASRFKMILTPGGKLSKQADKLIAELIGEQFSLIPPEGVQDFTNRAIRWGQQIEAEARRYYSLHTNFDVTNGGFCLSDCGRWGSSPDGLVGKDGVLELKAPQATTHVEYLLDNDAFLADYGPQVHGHLLVTGRSFCHALAYCPGLPPLLVRVERDEFTDKLSLALESFWDRYQSAIKRIKG